MPLWNKGRTSIRGDHRIGAQGILRIPNEASTAQTDEVWAVLRHFVPNKGLQPIAASPIPARLSLENGFGKPFSNGKPEKAKPYSIPNFSKKYSQTH